MENKSKVKSCAFKKEVTNTFGKFYSFKVDFENGDSGFFLSKKQDGYPFNEVGKDVEYVLDKKSGTKQDGTAYEYSNIKPVKKPFTPQGGAAQLKNPKAEVMEMALTHSGYASHKDFEKVIALYDLIMEKING